MALRKIQNGDEVIHVFDLDDPNVPLDVSSDPWNLPLGSASILQGVDILRPGSLRGAPLRKPIGVSLPADDRPVTYATGSMFQGRAAVRIKDRVKCGGVDFSPAYRGVSGATFTLSTQILFLNNGFGVTNGYTSTAWSPGDRIALIESTGSKSRGVYRITEHIDQSRLRVDCPIAYGGTLFFTIIKDRGYNYGNSSLPSAVLADFDPKYNLTKNHFEYEATGPWSESAAGGIIIFNEDKRGSSGIANATRLVASVESVMRPNDTLRWSQALFSSGDLPDNPDKFHLIYSEFFDKRGVYVTNGRKVWIVQDGEYVQFFDFGSDDYLGARWYPAQIAPNMMMLTSPKYAPRILHLNRTSSDDTADNSSLSGMIAPIMPNNLEEAEGSNWQIDFSSTGAGGTLTYGTNGSVRVKVRAVNSDDSAESRFVDARSEATGTGVYPLAITSTQTDKAVRIYSGECATVTGMTRSFPLHERWTHIEVWRKLSLGGDYFREGVIVIGDLENESPTSEAATGAGLVTEDPPDTSGTDSGYVMKLADADLVALPFLTANDLNAGGLPPICQESATLAGITVCAGRADASVTMPTAYARGVYASAYTMSSASPSVVHIDSISGEFTSYTFKDGDQLVIYMAHHIPSIVGTYDIVGKTDNDTITVETPSNFAGDSTGAYGYIRRPYKIDWPKIENDEEVWYSRTDKFAPESFPVRKLRLGYRGHEFRALRPIGNYVVCVMDASVHMIYYDGTDLKRETVSSEGMGTPWRDSVAVVNKAMVWAHPDGPVILTVSNSADAQGQRGQVAYLDETGAMRQWFRDAYDNGWPVDTGIDTLNNAIRFRRKVDENTFETLMFSTKYNRWCQLADDSGQWYARASNVEADAESESVLYSVTKEGAVIKCVHYTNEDPYAGSVVQDVLGDGYTVRSSGIDGPTGTITFGSKMIGDVVRFRSADATIDGTARVIRNATNRTISFDAVEGLSEGDEFIIGANRFRLKLAPFKGEVSTTNKNIHAACFRILKGDRHKTGVWDVPEDGVMTVRVYRDYEVDAVDEQDREIAIYDHDDNRGTEGRQSSIAGDGSALEVELECIESRVEWLLEVAEYQVRDDGDPLIVANTQES